MDEDAHFPMEPMSDIFVGEGVNIVSMCKTVSESNADTNSMWLAQVRGGSFWRFKYLIDRILFVDQFGFMTTSSFSYLKHISERCSTQKHAIEFKLCDFAKRLARSLTRA